MSNCRLLTLATLVALAAARAGAQPASGLLLAYVDPETENVLSLSDGATVQFPKIQVGSVSTLTLIAANSGTAAISINSISLASGSASVFQLVSLPAMPASLGGGQQFRFGIRFTPTQQQSYSGAMVLTAGGQRFTMNFQAQGVGSLFTYTYGPDGQEVLPGGTIAIPDTTVGQTASVSFSITNRGTGDGAIPLLAVSGQGLSAANLPSLPVTVHPNATQQFTLLFSPTQPAAINGKLTIGNDSFTITGTGLGSRLVYSYSNAVASVDVAEGGAVIFPPVEVGKSFSQTFSIGNTGTVAASIFSIHLSAASATFSLEGLPSMPLSLVPGSSITFLVGYSPNATGNLGAELRVNTSPFALTGTGTAPPALPSYRLQPSDGAVPPAQQSDVTLELTSAYSAAISGTLKLAFVPSGTVDDPSIQFATGGRTVSFTIPANSTSALFNGKPSVPLQTGTTAGTISLSPSFSLQNGFDMTPALSPAVSLTLARSAPQLLTGSIASQTGSSFALVLGGYSTTRGLRQLDIQITPAAGANFTATRLTVELSSPSSAWFQGAASLPFGGSFLITVPFVLQGGGGDMVRLLRSLSVTATNDAGTSDPITVTIP